MSDTLRGMRGIMLDIHRRPDKLLAAQEKVLRFELEYAHQLEPRHRHQCRLHPAAPRLGRLHVAGAVREVLLADSSRPCRWALVEAGIMPFVFYEGVWDQRLKYLAELPKGKTAGLVPVQRHLQGEGSRRRHHVHHGRHAQLACCRPAPPSKCATLTKRLCEEVGKGGGFIMSVGVGEMEGCRPDLVKVWVDATKEFGVYA